MRFMMIMFPKVYENAKPGWVPNFKDMEAMGKYNEELGKAGVLLALDGLTPPATMSARITGSDNEMVEVRRMFHITDFDPETQKEIQKKYGDAVATEMSQ